MWLACACKGVKIQKYQNQEGKKRENCAFMLSIVTKAGCNCCKLPLKTTGEDEEEKEVTTGVAAAEEISVDAGVTTVF